jgi:hypothetical protein
MRITILQELCVPLRIHPKPQTMFRVAALEEYAGRYASRYRNAEIAIINS